MGVTDVTEDLLTAEIDASEPTSAVPAGRGPATAACILLPVWGSEFIAQFLDYSLPTLLAPGNVPAVAQRLPTRFVFLTRSADRATFQDHPTFRHLTQVTEVEFLPIDDLITQGNHSTTITLAYAQAVRAAGAAMLDTCFFFLVSDYIMADGSLAAVFARMQAGASAVQAGNFQLQEETAESWLDERFADRKTSVALPPRELVRWGLGCLHPVALASTINFPLCHNTEVNRLLWRVDDETLLGRFYLLHMICIRPEMAEFVIGSSCDYSFVPEMCPSGNVVTITDSDDYLVVEVQPRWHESHFIRAGSSSAVDLAKSLSKWTTAQHRANAQQTIVFHAGDLPPGLREIVAEADSLIEEIGGQLMQPPQPHRDHPYWRGAIAAFNAAVARRSREEGEGGPGATSRHLIGTAVRWVRNTFFGLVPEVTRAHPRWGDLRWPLAACEALMTEPQPRVLIAATRATALTDWLRTRMPHAVFVSLRRLQRHRPVVGLEPGLFDACVVEFIDNDFAEANDFLRLIKPALRPNGQILLFAVNDRWLLGAEIFGHRFAAHTADLALPGLWPIELYLGSASRARWWINGACVRLVGDLFRRPVLLLPLRLIAGAVLLPIAIGANLVGSRSTERSRGGRIKSSVFVRFQLGRRATASPSGTIAVV